jgi:hypothetical protein
MEYELMIPIILFSIVGAGLVASTIFMIRIMYQHQAQDVRLIQQIQTAMTHYGQYGPRNDPDRIITIREDEPSV